MDEMRFTRGIVSKILRKAIHKRTGYEIDIQLNDVTTTIQNGKTHLHVDIDAELDKDELIKILKNVGLN